MNKPCRDCYQVRNIHGNLLVEQRQYYKWRLSSNGHVTFSNDMQHKLCDPNNCSGHSPKMDPFETFVMKTLMEEGQP